MINDIVNTLLGSNDTVASDECDINAVEDLATDVILPRLHVDFLMSSNGISVFNGYFRLFGVLSSTSIDMIEWNHPETWKFAWPESLRDFWCFGETAWGDQYAYRRDELGMPSEANVYFLDAFSMNPEPIADCFSQFLENEFLRNAHTPYDANIVAVRHRLGEILPHQHITYIPSPLVSGEETIDSVIMLNAVASMIINGDLSRQLANELQERRIKAIEMYEDIRGRTRARVQWY